MAAVEATITQPEKKDGSKEVRAFIVPVESFDLVRQLIAVGVYDSIEDFAQQAFMKHAAEARQKIKIAFKGTSGGGAQKRRIN